DRGLAIWQDRGMGEPADMPDLHENRAAMTVNLIGHEAPGLHLGFRVMARRARVAMAGLVDVAWLCDDKTGACPLAVVLGHQRIGEVAISRQLSLGSARAGDRWHDDTVLEVKAI